MRDKVQMGWNRTGVDMSPIDSLDVIDEARNTPPSSNGDRFAILGERGLFLAYSESLGTVPPPGTLKGMLETGIQLATAGRPEVFIDKLGERLAFERSGVRMYEALIHKFEVCADHSDFVPMETLRAFRDAEQNHFELVRDAFLTIGADPTALTPSADVVAVQTLGVAQVLLDPRSSTAHSISAILTIELIDNEGWPLLVSLAEGLGLDEIAQKFRVALIEEENHLHTIRRIYSELVRRDTVMFADTLAR